MKYSANTLTFTLQLSKGNIMYLAKHLGKGMELLQIRWALSITV